LRAGLWGRPRVDEDRPLPTVVDDEYLVLRERMQVENATRLLSAHSFGKEHCPGVITDGPPITIVPRSTSWSTKASRKSQSGWDWTGPRSQVAPARNLTITRRRRMGASFAAGLPLPTPPPPAPPALVVPGPREVSFGRLVGSVGPGTRRILVSIDERLRAEKAVRGHRFDFAVALLLASARPRRGLRLRAPLACRPEAARARARSSSSTRASSASGSAAPPKRYSPTSQRWHTSARALTAPAKLPPSSDVPVPKASPPPAPG
jgi:hypothetical protein